MKKWTGFIFAITLTLPWLFFKYGNFDLHPPVVAFLSGLAIFGSAFVLCWCSEAAQKDISQTLALAFLALIAVLPEYVVDAYFAYMAAKKPEYASYAVANMTGANRLLIGFGWSFAFLLYFLKSRNIELKLEENHSIEISFLAIATLYSFIIPLKGRISIWDAVILIFLFFLYIRVGIKTKIVVPKLTGPALALGDLKTPVRQITNISLFLYAGYIILISAKPFADGLVETGKIFGIEEFILVQWVAPFASEAPEIIVVSLFVLKLKPGEGFGTLISSKVNQWTLLIGMLPIIYSISLGGFAYLGLDTRQTQEILLTSAQSAFGVCVLANLRLNAMKALTLFILFFVQLLIPHPMVRLFFSGLYLVLTIFILTRDKHSLHLLFKTIRNLPRMLK